MEPDDDHLPSTTAPDPLRSALEEARQVRHAIHEALFEATQAFRDALAARDPHCWALAYGHMHALEMQWAEQDQRVWLLRGQWRPRWHGEGEQYEAA
jgi:hypothetical protein